MKWLSLVVWTGVAGLAAYFIWQEVRALHNMALGYADGGEMARLIFNTLDNPHELFLRVNTDKPLFYDHFQPGIFPLVLLGALGPPMEMTIILQVVAVIGTALPIYLIGRHVFGTTIRENSPTQRETERPLTLTLSPQAGRGEKGRLRRFFRFSSPPLFGGEDQGEGDGSVAKRDGDRVSALLLVVVWLVYPSVSQLIYSGSYGFHFFNFNLPLYFFALWFWLRGQRGGALLIAVWALLIKEEAAIMIGMFGVYLAVIERRRGLGVALTAGAFVYFLFASSVLIPYFNGGEYKAMGYFGHLGGSKLEILLSPLTKPQLFWGKLFEPATFCFAGALLGPLLFLPLKKPSVLFIGSLTFLFVSEWYNPMGKSIAYWYQTSLLPVVFCAFILTQPRRARLIGAVVSGVVLSIFLGHTFWSKTSLVVPLAPGRLALVKRMGATIEHDATLVATQRIAARFITVKYLYLDPDLPASTDYVFMDLRDRWRRPGNLVWLRQLREFQRKVEARPDLRLVAAEDGLLLYARRGEAIDARSRVEAEALPSAIVKQEQELAGGVTVQGFVLDQQSAADRVAMDRLRVRVYSAVSKPTDADVAARCVLVFGDEQYATEFQPLGQGIWPTNRWQLGKIYVDEFVVSVPASLRGQKFAVQFVAEAL